MSLQVAEPRCRSEVRRPIRVLLVDDQPFVAAALSRLLATETDIQVHCCLDGRDAVACANQVQPALILQDLAMLGIDGLTLVKMFATNPATARIPIVVLSGTEDEQMRARALASGATECLVKLPAAQPLVACIRRLVANSAAPFDAEPNPMVALDPDMDATLDLSVIAGFRDLAAADSPDFAVTLLDEFLQEAISQVEVLRDALLRGDLSAVTASAHRLKGGAVTIGASRMAALCKQFEAGVSEESRDVELPRLLAEIDDELVRVREACLVERRELERSAQRANG